MVPIGPAFSPRIVLSFMAAVSAVLVVQDLVAARRRRQAVPAAPAADAVRPNYALVLASFVVFGLYIAVLPALGFRIATFLFVTALQVTLEWPRTWQRWLIALAVAVATTAICVVAFENYLSVLLPRGTWSGL
jgi:hypothetical protein